MVTLPDVTAPLATTRGGSVLATRSGRVWRNRYSPHGFRMLAVAAGRCGFNGEFQEHSGIYLLGSYRAYNPGLMRFHSADSASPFGRGGLNAYAYCLGDPVNYRDPSGHVPWWVGPVAGIFASVVAAPLAAALLPATGVLAGQITVAASAIGSVAGALSLGSSIASITLEGSKAGEVMGALSLGTGIVAGVAAGVAMRDVAARLLPRLNRRAPAGAQRPDMAELNRAVDNAEVHLQQVRRQRSLEIGAGDLHPTDMRRMDLESEVAYAELKYQAAVGHWARALNDGPPSYWEVHLWQLLSVNGHSSAS